MTNLLSPWPHFDEEQVQAVTSVLECGNVNYWTGPQGKAFEKEFATWSGSSYSIALANGSLALSSAYLALNIVDGAEVITTPRTFIATSSSAVLLRATPVFADVDSDSGCITAETIEPLITPKTTAISVVHLGGWPADMSSICALAKAYNLSVIEDCAQAHGASIFIDNEWKPVGCFGDIAAWSFCQDKIMSTGGEGGMVTTSNLNLWDVMWSLKDHGKTWSAVHEKIHPSGFRWLHERFGSNFRMTEMQSALGRIQLNRMNEWSHARARNAQILIDILRNCSACRVPTPSFTYKHAWYKLHAYIRPEALSSSWSRDRVLEEISLLGYPALSGSCSEIYLESSFRNSGLTPQSRLPVAQLLGETSLMFLVHPTITESQARTYGEAIASVLSRASR